MHELTEKIWNKSFEACGIGKSHIWSEGSLDSIIRTYLGEKVKELEQEYLDFHLVQDRERMREILGLSPSSEVGEPCICDERSGNPYCQNINNGNAQNQKISILASGLVGIKRKNQKKDSSFMTYLKHKKLKAVSIEECRRITKGIKGSIRKLL